MLVTVTPKLLSDYSTKTSKRIGYNGIGYFGTGYDAIGHNGIGYNGFGYFGTGYDAIGHNGIGYNGIGYIALTPQKTSLDLTFFNRAFAYTYNFTPR